MKIQESFLMVISLLAAIIISTSIGYSQSGSTTLSVTGTVSKESDFSELLRSSNIDIKDSGAYNVKVTLKNTGSRIVKFDEIIGIFYSPKVGSIPHIISTKIEVRTPNGYLKTDAAVIEIAPGKEKDFEFTTLGYTSSLLQSAGNVPLRFSLQLRIKNVFISGSSMSILPNINKLVGTQKHILSFSPPTIDVK